MMFRCMRRFALGFVAFFLTLGCMAEIRLPRIFSDHAVLQRDGPIRVWGWASPGAELTVTLHGQASRTVADRLGEWTAWLAPEAAGGPYRLSVEGKGAEGSLTVSDVLIGDVWLASGQSNMEMPLNGFPPSAVVKDAAEEIKHANQPLVRLMLVERRASDYPLDDLTSTWTTCTPETAAKFSAVAYFFGREISAREHVAVGLIDSSWGGTPADSWVSLEGLASDAALMPVFRNRARFVQGYADRELTLAADKREDAEARAAGRPAVVHRWQPSEESWRPGGLYNGMIAPLAKYSIKGFLWYQGETDSSPERAPLYRRLFGALITDWRAQFAQGDLPFLFAQISSFNSPAEDWGTVRDAQRRTLALANTAMAVTLDVGLAGNVHPPDKQTVAARLALGARAIAYREPVPYASPLFREATTQPGAMRVWFDHAEGLRSHGGSVAGFELAGADHLFMPANARLEGDSVVVESRAVVDPRYVRYGWSGVVTDWLYNAAGLPASTFTSEESYSR